MRESIAGTFLANQGRKLREFRRRIEWAIRQMSDEDVNWRPNDQSNSVANLVVHICGNIAQRYLSGLSATPDVRHREAEFSLEQWHTVPDLLQMLAEAFDTVDAIFTGLDAEKLLAPQTVGVGRSRFWTWWRKAPRITPNTLDSCSTSLNCASGQAIKYPGNRQRGAHSRGAPSRQIPLAAVSTSEAVDRTGAGVLVRL